MSLKAFHIVFITASILLAFGFAAWSFVHRSDEGKAALLYFGLGSAAAGCALVAYLVYVLRKLRNESYL